MEGRIRNWERIIRGEKYDEVKVNFYPCRNDMKGEYEISGKFIFEIYKTYKGVENWMNKHGFTPVIEKDGE